jgi:hypothetical protein
MKSKPRGHHKVISFARWVVILLLVVVIGGGGYLLDGWVRVLSRQPWEGLENMKNKLRGHHKVIAVARWVV